MGKIDFRYTFLDSELFKRFKYANDLNTLDYAKDARAGSA